MWFPSKRLNAKLRVTHKEYIGSTTAGDDICFRVSFSDKLKQILYTGLGIHGMLCGGGGGGGEHTSTSFAQECIMETPMFSLTTNRLQLSSFTVQKPCGYN